MNSGSNARDTLPAFGSNNGTHMVHIFRHTFFVGGRDFSLNVTHFCALVQFAQSSLDYVMGREFEDRDNIVSNRNLLRAFPVSFCGSLMWLLN